MTEFVFRSDSYLKLLEATVTEVLPGGGIVLDRTIFYAASGGQPGDSGRLSAEPASLTIATTIHPDGDKSRIVHVPAEGQPQIEPGMAMTAEIGHGAR